ncbi:MAG: hypothetical protein M3494_02320 [Actinomycetota bacterium]|nr:hypothetical protein [Rubrobacter sp.]MDQ3506842.1 hypothetical protein [Actinomycetota bacterium]
MPPTRLSTDTAESSPRPGGRNRGRNRRTKVAAEIHYSSRALPKPGDGERGNHTARQKLKAAEGSVPTS